MLKTSLALVQRKPLAPSPKIAFIPFVKGKITKKEQAEQRKLLRQKQRIHTQYGGGSGVFSSFLTRQPIAAQTPPVPQQQQQQPIIDPRVQRVIDLINEDPTREDRLIFSIDIGERQFGCFAGAVNWKNLQSTLEILFLDNMNMFPVTMPTQPSLQSYYGMKPLDPGELRRRATRENDNLTKEIYQSKLEAFDEAEERLQAAVKECAKYRKQHPHVPPSAMSFEDDPDVQYLYDLKEKGMDVNMRRTCFTMSPFFDPLARKQDDEDAPIPTDLEGLVKGFSEILPIYYDFWVATIGKPTDVVIESQPITITTTGAIVEAACATFFRLMGVERVHHIKASKKLKAYHLDESQIKRMIPGNLWLDKYWSRFGVSGALNYLHLKMSDAKMAEFAPDLIWHSEKRIALGLEPLEYKHQSKGRKRKAAEMDDGDQEDEGPNVVPTNIGNQNEDDDDDDEVIVLRPSSSSTGTNKQPKVTENTSPSAAKKPSKKKTPAAAPAILKDPFADLSKRKEHQEQTTIREPAVAGGKTPKKRTKKTTATASSSSSPPDAPTSKAAYMKAKAMGVNPFANKGNKRTAEMRLENKDEAVARMDKIMVDELFDLGDLAGYEWLLRYRHMWNHSKRKDASDAFLQLIAYVLKDVAKERKEEAARKREEKERLKELNAVY
jgi:hypothetical protein